MLGRYTTGPCGEVRRIAPAAVAVASSRGVGGPCRPSRMNGRRSGRDGAGQGPSADPVGRAAGRHRRYGPAAANRRWLLRRFVRHGPRPASARPRERARPILPRCRSSTSAPTPSPSPPPRCARAMAAAEVGDDVFGEDPTVNALEERAAELLGKEAGLFVASGTMGNLVVADGPRPARRRDHRRRREPHRPRRGGRPRRRRRGERRASSATARTGRWTSTRSRDAFRDPTDAHEPHDRRWSSIENAHSHSMNQPLRVAYTARGRRGRPRARRAAPRRRRAVLQRGGRARRHARRSSPRRPTRSTFCLSKGLACPVGSVVVGSRTFIGRARRARKLLGGGMRQAGVLAAAGLVALRDGDAGMIDRLAEDHANARRLAEALADDARHPSPGRHRPARRRAASTRPASGRTSSCSGSTATGARSSTALAGRGVLMVGYPHGQIRAATHYGIAARRHRAPIVAAVRRRARARRAATGPRVDDVREERARRASEPSSRRPRGRRRDAARPSAKEES